MTRSRTHLVMPESLHGKSSTVYADLALTNYSHNACCILQSSYLGSSLKAALQGEMGQFVEEGLGVRAEQRMPFIMTDQFH